MSQDCRLEEVGLSSQVIAAWIVREKVTINRIVNKLKLLSNDDIPERKSGPGRSRQMKPDNLFKLKRQITKYPAMTAADLKETMLEVLSFCDRSQPAQQIGSSEASPDTQDKEEEARLLCCLQQLVCS
jgi:hypothetical protein